MITSNMNNNSKNNVLMLENIRQKLTILEYFGHIFVIIINLGFRLITIICIEIFLNC